MRRFQETLMLAVCVFLAALPVIEAQEPVRDHQIVPEDCFELGAIGACEVSPDGAHAAYVEVRWGRGKEGRPGDLWVVNLDSGSRQRLTFDGFAPSGVAWSPDSQWIYFQGRDPRKLGDKAPWDGSTQVWRVSLRGGDPFPVTRIKDGIKGFDLGRGGGVLYYTTDEKVYAPEWKALRKEFAHLEYGHGIAQLNPIFKLDLEGWRTEKVLDATRVIEDFAVAPDGRRIAMIATDDNEAVFREGWSRVEIVDLATKAIENITPQEWRKDHPSPYGWIEEPEWSDDSGALAFSVSFDGFATRLYAAEWEGGKAAVREVRRPGISSHEGGLQWKPASRDLCFRAGEKARVRVCSIAAVQNGGQGAAQILTPGDVVIGAFSFSESGETMATVVETTTHFSDIYVSSGGAGRRVTNVNPQVDTWKLPQISIFSWAGADGDTVEGILELPPGYKRTDGPLPMLVELHGGPTDATRFALRFWIYGRTLMAANGYALFSPNYHGSTGYGDEFTAKLIGRENDIEVIDIRTGVRALIAEGIADPQRIGVMGWSNGGYLVNCMLVAEPDLFKAASSGAGVLDMVIQWGTEDTPGHVINFSQGLPWQNPEGYRKASPLYGLDRVKTPTLIHVGGSDPRVPPAHSRALYRALFHYLKVPVELVVYPGEPHGLTTQENRLAKMKWDVAWFEKYLLGKEAKE